MRGPALLIPIGTTPVKAGYGPLADRVTTCVHIPASAVGRCRTAAVVSRVVPWALVLVLASGAVVASEVDLVLCSGGVVHGDLIESDLDHLYLRLPIPTHSGAIVCIMTYRREEVARIVEVSAAVADYEHLAATVMDTASGHLELAEWCRDQDLVGQGRIQALRALHLRPEDRRATTVLLALGMTYADGQWQDETAYLARSGRVRYAGQVMTQTQAEAMRLRSEDDRQVSDTITAIASDQARMDACAGERLALEMRASDLADSLNDIQSQIALANPGPVAVPDVLAAGKLPAAGTREPLRTRLDASILQGLHRRHAEVMRALAIIAIERQEVDRRWHEAQAAQEIAHQRLTRVQAELASVSASNHSD